MCRTLLYYSLLFCVLSGITDLLAGEIAESPVKASKRSQSSRAQAATSDSKPQTQPQQRRQQNNVKTTPERPRPEQAQPAWIWLQNNKQPEQRVCFRKEFSARGAVTARLFAACDDAMTVFIDGQKVLQHGTWERPVFRDVTRQLKMDTKDHRHVIAIEAVNGASVAGLLVKLDLESGGRNAWSVVSDTSWQVSTQPAAGWKRAGFRGTDWKHPQLIAPLGGGPWAKAITAATLAAAAPLREPTATPAESLKVRQGFQAELLYSVPKGQQGSWVNLCVDPRGRLIVSDQYGSLYRVTPPATTDNRPPANTRPANTRVEKIPVDIGEAQGLLWAFDSLYVSVNKGKKYAGGLYRVTDADGDDTLDTVRLLRPLKGTGEHGPHAVVPHPDGKSLIIVCGNRTQLTSIDTSRVPRVWDEDLLLPRLQGRFMRGVRAPGGYISRIDPEGKQWELIATGFRNQFDAAFNADGELFTYDADMEWDINTPWYRPTRICHVLSGAEFGWRSGGGKWPVEYPDSLPPVIDVGPGSPTGITFGYGSRFPHKYQNSLFIADWSYGKLYAVQLQPRGASYTAKMEEFVTGTPLPLTDVVINPHDGAMYFLIGGRRVQSGLYRVTYQGAPTTSPADGHQLDQSAARAQRRRLEALHHGDHPQAVESAWPSLGHSDRFIRFAARVAIEHRPVREWQARALQETDPQTLLTALLALVRQHARPNKGQPPNIDTPLPTWSADDPPQSAENARLRRQILEALDRLEWRNLTLAQRIQTLRVTGLTFLRIGPPDAEERPQLIQRAMAVFPAQNPRLNSELAALLVYLQAPQAAPILMKLLSDAPTQEEQIDLAKTLRHLRSGWTPELRAAYFRWTNQARGYRGGASFATFVQRIRQDALTLLSAEQKQKLKPILNAKPPAQPAYVTTTKRPVIANWTMDTLVPLVENGLTGRDYRRGRKMFAAANCFACHRFDNQGGSVGPDLTILSGRFSPRDILESIVDPNKQISDQYGSVQILTTDGKIVAGRIVNLAGDTVRVQTNMLAPSSLPAVDRKLIEEIVPSKVSMMPAGLLNTLTKTEILDLMAYLLSRGDPQHKMFQSP